MLFFPKLDSRICMKAWLSQESRFWNHAQTVSSAVKAISSQRASSTTSFLLLFQRPTGIKGILCQVELSCILPAIALSWILRLAPVGQVSSDRFTRRHLWRMWDVPCHVIYEKLAKFVHNSFYLYNLLWVILATENKILATATVKLFRLCETNSFWNKEMEEKTT